MIDGDQWLLEIKALLRPLCISLYILEFCLGNTSASTWFYILGQNRMFLPSELEVMLHRPSTLLFLYISGCREVSIPDNSCQMFVFHPLILHVIPSLCQQTPKCLFSRRFRKNFQAKYSKWTPCGGGERLSSSQKSRKWEHGCLGVKW